LRTETVQAGWQRLASWDLPARHTVTTATDAGLAVRSFTPSEHELLKRAKRMLNRAFGSVRPFLPSEPGNQS
jgi:hypothetical protein